MDNVGEGEEVFFFVSSSGENPDPVILGLPVLELSSLDMDPTCNNVLYVQSVVTHFI